MKHLIRLALILILCLVAMAAVAEGCAICAGDGKCNSCGGDGWR